MEINEAILAFDALSQETRLKVFRLLVEYGPAGTPAGTLSDALGVPHNTLSFHLFHLTNAGLVFSRREGRSIIYSPNFEFFNNLIRYMVEDCCREDMASIRDNTKKNSSIIELANCCPPPSKEKKP